MMFLVSFNLEIAMKTPPFGFLLFVMRGVAPDYVSMGEIYKSTFPFVLIDVVTIGLALVFPQIILLLPKYMM